MQLIVVYKGIGKIAADQLKKLSSESSADMSSFDERRSIIILPMEEKTYIDSSKVKIFTDPILFIDDVNAGQGILPIAKPKKYGYGVRCGFAGPQAVLTVDTKALADEAMYEGFVNELNSLTFQQISNAPHGINRLWDLLAHGVKGAIKRKNDLKQQQLIYGVTKFYREDLISFVKSNEK